MVPVTCSVGGAGLHKKAQKILKKNNAGENCVATPMFVCIFYRVFFPSDFNKLRDPEVVLTGSIVTNTPNFTCASGEVAL